MNHEAKYDKTTKSVVWWGYNGQSVLEMWVFRISEKVWLWLWPSAGKRNNKFAACGETLPMFGFHPKLPQPAKVAKLWEGKNECLRSSHSKKETEKRNWADKACSQVWSLPFTNSTAPGIDLNDIFGKTKSVSSRIKGFKVEKKLCQENGKHLVVASCC